MIEVFILAVALSMDAFAVSIGLGSKRVSNTRALALYAAVYFGVFQALMPLIGYLGGKGVLGWLDDYARWISFTLLLLVGVKMIHEALHETAVDAMDRVTHRAMLVLAVATSIDAMAAGFTLNLLAFNPYLACGLIGLTTFVFSLAGVFVGFKSGTWLENKAELLGGVILILIGLKILLV